MKGASGRRAPAMPAPERAFWRAFSRSLRGSARRRSRRTVYSLLRRL